MLRVVADEADRTQLLVDLDEIVKEGARRMLAAALEVEVDAYVEDARGQRDEQGRALVVRNGRARTRKVTTGAGAVEVSAPRVNDPEGIDDAIRESERPLEELRRDYPTFDVILTD